MKKDALFPRPKLKLRNKNDPQDVETHLFAHAARIMGKDPTVNEKERLSSPLSQRFSFQIAGEFVVLHFIMKIFMKDIDPFLWLTLIRNNLALKNTHPYDYLYYSYLYYSYVCYLFTKTN